MITGMPGAIAMKPGSASLPMFGVVPQLVDGEGQPLEDAQGTRIQPPLQLGEDREADQGEADNGRSQHQDPEKRTG